MFILPPTKYFEKLHEYWKNYTFPLPSLSFTCLFICFSVYICIIKKCRRLKVLKTFTTHATHMPANTHIFSSLSCKISLCFYNALFSSIINVVYPLISIYLWKKFLCTCAHIILIQFIVFISLKDMKVASDQK